MNLIPALNSAIEKNGYTNPTPIQEATIPLALAGNDILGCAQTGTGKTAAFALPILQHLTESKKDSTAVRSIRALVLAPTRELAIQNFETFNKLGRGLKLRTTTVFGGVSQVKQVQMLKSGVDILVATPGRLIDLINQGFINLSSLEVFVLDEADRMLDMGFIHDVKRVITLLPEKRQTLLFSATMPKEVESLALTLLKNPKTVKVDPVTSTVDKIKQSVYFVGKDDKKKLLLQLLNEKGVSTALVFTRTKSNADQVVRILNQSKIDAMAIHGNKSQNARQTALNSFKTGRISVLAATDIAARGIDITELPFVINYNIPEEAETYIHRIGRTGRAGLGGTAISMCCSEELGDWRAIERLTKVNIPTSECEWSVKDMKQTPKPAKKPFRSAEKSDNNRRGSSQNASKGGRSGDSRKRYNDNGYAPANKSRRSGSQKTSRAAF